MLCRYRTSIYDKCKIIKPIYTALPATTVQLQSQELKCVITRADTQIIITGLREKQQ